MIGCIKEYRRVKRDTHADADPDDDRSQTVRVAFQKLEQTATQRRNVVVRNLVPPIDQQSNY